MAISVKDSNTRKFELTGGYISGDKLLDESGEVDIIAKLKEAYGEGTEFKLTVNVKEEKEI